MTQLLHRNITQDILKAFYEVYNALGYGFLEKVYENALAYELRKRGLQVSQQYPIKAYYDGIVMGEFFADLIVEGLVIVELKSAVAITPAHMAQLKNYLGATNIEVGLLLNFGPSPVFKRQAFANERKKQYQKIPVNP